MIGPQFSNGHRAAGARAVNAQFLTARMQRRVISTQRPARLDITLVPAQRQFAGVFPIAGSWDRSQWKSSPPVSRRSGWRRYLRTRSAFAGIVGRHDERGAS